ncbi:AMP-dependent synthetase/ligase [Saxibacter everestensis]|uniref:Acyl-CoA synthetase n=1 Tax=Saxibacter everestensis TaxID=2909229 RepID=A0ABY8QZ21_9MICO|nr:AMP-dependent synthetase/ligase [Brevibacteriaceae bacterium ZFBP1038]
MRENSIEQVISADASSNITDLLLDRVSRLPDHPLFALRKDDHTWADVTAREFLETVHAVAKGFIAAGLQPGDRVGILSRTRYEWTITDFALWFAGAISVPIYETSSAQQIAWNLGQTGAVGVVVESAHHQQSTLSIQAGLHALTNIWCIESGALEQLKARGAEVTDDVLEARRRSATAQDTATIIFTSGTTGAPKGCELSHANFVDLALSARQRIPEVVMNDEPSSLLFMPLAHVFARFIEVLNVASNVRTGFTASTADLLDDLGSFRPSFILAVPRVFEKVYNSAAKKAGSGSRGKLFSAAVNTAIDFSTALDSARGPSIGLRMRHALFGRLVYSKLKSAMGGRLGYAVSGGASLGARLGHFYRGIGLTVLEGYGLTETTAPIVVNCPDAQRIGTVGPPLPGSAIRIADDAEILVRGIGVFQRYWNDQAATAAAFTDGWFHTGDFGSIDDNGYLSVIGRKKELLVTAGGKNVSPSGIENRVSAEPEVAQCMLVGDGRQFIAALVTLDRDMIERDRSKDSPEVIQAVRTAFQEANQSVSRPEQVKKFLILDSEFTEADGTLTPSLKLKRNVIAERFGSDIDALYATAGHDVTPRENAPA